MLDGKVGMDGARARMLDGYSVELPGIVMVWCGVGQGPELDCYHSGLRVWDWEF